MKEYIILAYMETREGSSAMGMVDRELIRCKDCKYYTGKWCTKYSTKQFDINDICKAEDDFCSDAERKDNK